MRKRSRKDIGKMERLGRIARYHEALRVYLLSVDTSQQESRIRNTFEALKEMQYAIALQHYGLFDNALETFDHIAKVAGDLRESGGISSFSIYCNALAHKGVLLERLDKPKHAIKTLNRIPKTKNVQDAKIAKASYQSWIDQAQLKCLFSLKEYSKVRRLAQRCKNHGDWNQRIWGGLFLAMLKILDGKWQRSVVDTAVKELNQYVENMRREDVSCMPWIGLIAGSFLAEKLPAQAVYLLEKAHREATRLGKFFQVGAISEQLYLCYRKLKRRAEAKRVLLRSLQAFARCHLLFKDSFRRKLFIHTSKEWGRETATDILMRAANFLLYPEELVFSKMCRTIARQSVPKKRPWEVFESFVRDWAPMRYSGRYRHMEKGRATGDVLLIDSNNNGILLQAKHMKNPRKGIPKRLYVNEIEKDFGLRRVIRYVYVATTSDPAGWHENLWYSQDTHKLMQVVHQDIKVDVVLEPELQTDTVLNERLYNKYFRDIDVWSYS